MGFSRVWVAGRIASVIALAGIGAGAKAHAQSLQLPEIVITAPSPIFSRQQAAPPGTLIVVEDAFAPVTVVTEAEIARNTAQTLGDLLSGKPGISTSSFAPGAASRPVIRGLDNFRVRIQENGVGSHDVSDLGEDHGVPIDPLAAQKIEVVRGPATLRYGSQAIGGVVDVSNNRIPDRIPERGFGALVKGGLSSVDNGHDGGVLLDAGGKNVAIHADAFERRAGDYSIPGGRQANSALEAKGQSLGGSYIFDRGFIGAAISHYTSLYHVPGAESALRNTRIDLAQTKVTSKGELRLDSPLIDAIRFWAGATNYRHYERGLDENGMDGIGATFLNREQEGRAEIQLTPFQTRFGALHSAIGVQAGHQQLGTSGEAGGLLAPARTQTHAAYMFNELRVTDAFKLQAAGRIEDVRVRGTGAEFPADFIGGVTEPVETARERRFLPTSASVGALQDLPFGIVASLTGQYVERAPKAIELFAKGPHDAPGTFEIGIPDLVKETAQTIEFGLKRAKGPLRFDATAYYTQYSNFIFKRLTGLRCDDDFASCGAGEELTQIVYSQRDAKFRGVEAAAQLDVMPLGGGMFGVEGQFDMVRAEFSDGTLVPRIPPYRLGGGVFWRNDNWFARVGILHAFAQNRLGELETPTAGYDNVSAELSYTQALQPSAFGAREFTIGVKGDNLLNEDMRNAVSFRKDDVLLPGLNVRGFAALKF